VIQRRRGPEALKAVGQPRWLTARDPFGKLLESRELPRGTDLGAELMAEYERRTVSGWACEEAPSTSFAGFFCSKDGLRVLVNIAPADPGEPVTAPAGYSTWPRPDSQ